MFSAFQPLPPARSIDENTNFVLYGTGLAQPIVWKSSHAEWVFFKQDIADLCEGQIPAARRYLRDVFRITSNSDTDATLNQSISEMHAEGASAFFFPSYDEKDCFAWSPHACHAIAKFLFSLQYSYATQTTFRGPARDRISAYYCLIYGLCECSVKTVPLKVLPRRHVVANRLAQPPLDTAVAPVRTDCMDCAQ
jgi:hypothetical protein